MDVDDEGDIVVSGGLDGDVLIYSVQNEMIIGEI